MQTLRTSAKVNDRHRSTRRSLAGSTNEHEHAAFRLIQLRKNSSNEFLVQALAIMRLHRRQSEHLIRPVRLDPSVTMALRDACGR